jgi:ribose transport system ATP-binding protein
MLPEQPFLNLEGVSKSFPGVHALRNVDLAVNAGEIVSLVGQNGAGKSTLMTVLGGIATLDSGSISIGGTEVRITSPAVAEELGIGFVHQEPTLVPNMSVAANIFLHRERTKKGFLDSKAMRAQSSRIMSTLGFDIDPNRLVSNLSLVEKEVVEIAKAMLLDPRILILDEVTAPLDSDAVERLFELVSALKTQGMAIIFISHRLDEVIRISDRVVVLRDGAKVADLAVDGTITERQLITLMVGQRPADPIADASLPPGHVGTQLLSVRDLSLPPHYDAVSFTLARGEILGFAGLKGSGITEMLKTLFGAMRKHDGEILVDGRPARIKTPADAIERGIGMLTNDRQKEGLALTRNLTENITVSTLGRFASRWAFLRRRELKTNAATMVQTLGVKTTSVDQYALNLSGGNQQKVVLAKWMLRSLDALIADEPTRGVDVRAKDEIYKLLMGLKADGKAIILHSPEVTELLAVCDRVIVVVNGRIVAEVRAQTPEFDLRHILEMMHSRMRVEPAAVP